MEDYSSVGVSKKKVRKFLYHAYRASRLRQERVLAKKQLQDQLMKLKTMQFSDRVKREKLTREIRNLEQLINLVVKNEQRHVVVGQASDVAKEQLQKKVNELYDKLSEYLLYQQKRQKRILEIEDKIKNRQVTQPSATKRILERIDELEDKYHFLKRNTLTNPQDLQMLKQKLDTLRNRLV